MPLAASCYSFCSPLLMDSGFALSDNTRRLAAFVHRMCGETGARVFSLQSSNLVSPFPYGVFFILSTHSIFLLLSGHPRTIIDVLSLLPLKHPLASSIYFFELPSDRSMKESKRSQILLGEILIYMLVMHLSFHSVLLCLQTQLKPDPG